MVNIDKAMIKVTKGQDEQMVNAFVTYQFKWLPESIYQTQECEGKGTDPVWNYSKMHCIEDITTEIATELKEGSISYQVYAYPSGQSSIPKPDGGAALKKRMTMKRAERGDYDIDAEEEAKLLGTESPG